MKTEKITETDWAGIETSRPIPALLPGGKPGSPGPKCAQCGAEIIVEQGNNSFDSQWLRGRARIFDGETSVQASWLICKNGHEF